jgi:hypothetical protein
MSTKDALTHYIVYRVEKFEAKDAKEIKAKNLKPYDVAISTPEAISINCLLNEGITELINLISGLGTPTAWDNSNARLGVGDDATAPAATQSGLLAVTNKLYKAMNGGYPQISSQDCIWQADFIDTEAEFAWLEETISNTVDNAGDNLCRQNTSLGTKPSGQTWRLTATITFS